MAEVLSLSRHPNTHTSMARQFTKIKEELGNGLTLEQGYSIAISPETRVCLNLMVEGSLDSLLVF